MEFGPREPVLPDNRQWPSTGDGHKPNNGKRAGSFRPGRLQSCRSPQRGGWQRSGSLGTGGAGDPIITATGFAALLGVGVADDGVIYACNGENATSNLKIYRWDAEDTTGAVVPVVAFGGASGAIPGTVNVRCGDSFFARGAGTNTQLIASGSGAGYFTVFTTTDGTNFTANQIAIPATPGAGGFNRTVAFDRTNNAFGVARPTAQRFTMLRLISER